jgi:hypothetical protein
MSRLEKSVIAVVVVLALLAVVDFALNRGNSRVSTAARTVRDVAVDQYARLSGQPPKPETPPAPAPPEAGPPPRRAAPARATSPLDPAIATPATSPELPSTTPLIPLAADSTPTAEAAAPARRAFFMPGRTATWAAYGINVSSPVMIRAGGSAESGTDIAGPDGLTSSAFERRLDRQRGVSQRVVPSAPYLALIGRVCSDTTCSDPFVVGSNSVLCPSAIGTTGTLQLWTNNYVMVEGRRTTLHYANVAGGYSFYVEPAQETLCDAGAARPAGWVAARDEAVLDVGRTLNNPEFVISSSQSSWKPFFVPLGAPLIVRASGTMQPRGGSQSTGPDGIVVPTAATWSYPGERDLVVDAEHQLYEPALPYQALIGRLCGQDGCGPSFLVGAERVICPTPRQSDRLELWINHIIRPAGMLQRQTSVSFDAFMLQQRRGAYRFEITRAPANACGG